MPVSTVDARITGVTRFGLFVRIPGSGAEGLVPVRALGSEFFRHDESAHALVGDRTNRRFKLGDDISVKLVESAPLTGGLRFELAEGPMPQRNKPRVTPRSPSRKRKR